MNKYLGLVLRGIGMGAADVVPGVSGGTIAFITGIYEELINSIKSVNLSNVKLLAQFRIKDFWEAVNAKFLISVLGGIAISVFSLAKLMKYLLTNHPVLVWSFFFGLIIASALLVSKQVGKWSIGSVISLLLGGVVAFLITTFSPSSTPETWWFVMLSGAIAICAMILPGISGSFILLLLGKYSYIIDAVSRLKLDVIAFFMAGAVVGIISFSHFLSWLLKKYHSITVALLTGFMIGSLNKVWPWKEVLSTYTNSHGEIVPLNEANVLPNTYAAINQCDSQIVFAIVFAIIGFVLIVGVENWALKKEK